MPRCQGTFAAYPSDKGSPSVFHGSPDSAQAPAEPEDLHKGEGAGKGRRLAAKVLVIPKGPKERHAAKEWSPPGKAEAAGLPFQP